MEHMGEAMAGKYPIQLVVDRIKHQQAVFQILKMSKYMVKILTDQHHRQRSFEEGKIAREPKQIIETRTKQLQNHVIIEYLIKWKNLPAAYSTWEDDEFIHMHPKIPNN